MKIVEAVLPFVFMAAEVSWVLYVVFWRGRIRKMTVIANARIPGYPHSPIYTYSIDRRNGRITPRDLDQGAFSVDVDDEGITWCWGWEAEDVDALVVSYTLR